MLFYKKGSLPPTPSDPLPSLFSSSPIHPPCSQCPTRHLLLLPPLPSPPPPLPLPSSSPTSSCLHLLYLPPLPSPSLAPSSVFASSLLCLHLLLLPPPTSPLSPPLSLHCLHFLLPSPLASFTSSLPSSSSSLKYQASVSTFELLLHLETSQKLFPDSSASAVADQLPFFLPPPPQ